MLKIISGSRRNAAIENPFNVTRPTMQRVRKVIFDVLQNKVFNAKILDCFAGSGAMGLEALSLGAKFAFFFENDPHAARVIKKNIEKLKFSESSFLKKKDFFLSEVSDFNGEICDLMKNIHDPSKNAVDQEKYLKFDIIFIDPPYHKYALSEVLQKFADLGIRDSLCVFETESADDFPENYILRKKIGDKFVYFFNLS